MGWNYRLIRKTRTTPATKTVRVEIHKVLWDDEGMDEKGPYGWTLVPIDVTALFFVDVEPYSEDEAKRQLKSILTKMLEALDKPIIDSEMIDGLIELRT